MGVSWKKVLEKLKGKVKKKRIEVEEKGLLIRVRLQAKP